MQGSLAFAEEPPRARKRSDGLFFALFPDAGTARRIGRRADRFVGERRLRGRRLRDDRLHVSVQFVGTYPRLRRSIVHAAQLAGDAVSQPPFEVTFRFVESFEAPPSRGDGPSRHPLVLLGEGEGLFALHGRLGLAMQSIGLRPGETFVPHMTLLYGPTRIPRQAIEPIRFVVREFVLVHSERGLSKYHALGRWPLAGPSAAERRGASGALPPGPPQYTASHPPRLFGIAGQFAAEEPILEPGPRGEDSG